MLSVIEKEEDKIDVSSSGRKEPKSEENSGEIVLILSISCGVLVVGFFVVGTCVWRRYRNKNGR